MSCKIKYETERVCCSAIGTDERYNIFVRETAANERFLRSSLWTGFSGKDFERRD